MFTRFSSSVVLFLAANVLANPAILNVRADSPTNICTRWSQQSAVVNGTLYLYGGQTTTDAQQTTNTWNDDFLTLDLTQSWSIASPALSGLPQPSGPPAVALGYLWNSYNSLFLYGGEFADNPSVSPVPFALWEYAVGSATWTAHDSPTTSAGDNSEPDGMPVGRAAEGAGFSVPGLGRGWYFGGHQDLHTTAGWSYTVPRIYLRSMLEFTFPGSGNKQVTSLANGGQAGSDGVWRNVTDAQADADVFARNADGVLVFVPGYGAEGILLELGGGTNATFTELNIIDVYDIAGSMWYKQATSGPTPPMRVSPCAVVAAAADGSSYNVHMYAGQNLQPADSQTQLDDIWVLSLPSFTWIEVDTSNQSVPPGRSGHTCNAWDGQMVVVGGYVGDQISCDPGFYVFNMSSLAWTTGFTSLHNSDNPFSLQPSQEGDPTAVQGSYGYRVPAAIQSAIGGSALGGATASAPSASATSGPIASGSPAAYTVTATDGVIQTETARPASGSGNADNVSSGSSGTNVAAIAAGVVAGVLFLVACYLVVCAFIYRRRLQLYQHHMEASRRHFEKSRIENNAFTYSGNQSGQQSDNISRAQSSHQQSSSHQRSESPSANASLLDVPTTRTAASSTDDLLRGQEPTFVGIMLHPRRSLKVVNK